MNKRILIAILSLIIIAALAGAVWFYFANSMKSADRPGTNGESKKMLLSYEQVAVNDGKDGRPCWVVVDNTVYEISGFSKWVDGIHTSSSGKASCGRDLSSVIKESPHGKAKLRLLKEIGQLSQ